VCKLCCILSFAIPHYQVAMVKEGAKAWRAKESAKAKEAEQKRAEEQSNESASLAAATAATEKAQAEVHYTFKIALHYILYQIGL